MHTHESISSLFDGFGPFPSTCIAIINFALYCLKYSGLINARAVKYIYLIPMSCFYEQALKYFVLLVG